MPQCPACDHANPDLARFCNQCGQELAQVSVAPAQQAPTPQSYTPRHLADRILKNAAVLKGERKQVTVLFADVKGSTRLAQEAGAEHWHQILDKLFTLLSTAVHRYEGSVNQYTGDGIMALFGAPIAHEDHALRAAYAALAMREQVRSFADELRLQHGLNLSLRIGLNSGEVIVGAIGDDLRMDYTAQGHTVNLAARMEAIAEPGRIYVTRYTAGLLEGYFRLRSLGEMQVQGVDASMAVYELEAVGEIATRLGLSRMRGLSQFVGREHEMAQMEAALQEASAQGHGQVLSVSGNAGIGKSRLCHEFIQRCRARGITVHTASAVPYADAMPYHPVQQLLRGYFDITETTDAETARRKIAGTLLLQNDSARNSLGTVFDFLGLGTTDTQVQDAPPEMRMQRLKNLCAQVMSAKAGSIGEGLGPDVSVLLLEDVHWADAGSIDFFQSLFDCAVGMPLLIICNHRRDYVLEWLWPATSVEIALEALDETAIDGLLQELLGREPEMQPLHAQIRERAAGNPYFVEEAVRSLVEHGVLAGLAGAYELQSPLTDLKIPDSVQAILAARIDRLPPREKQTLRAASVLGKNFCETWLEDVLVAENRAWRESLQALVESGFLHPEGNSGQEYVFCHPLMQEVAYANQLGGERRKLHGRAAEALEAQLNSGEDNGDTAMLLAYHWRQAEAFREAAEWELEAASWLVRRDANATLARFRSALDAIGKLDPQDPVIQRLAVAARAGIVRSAGIIEIPEKEVAAAYRLARRQVAAEDNPSGLAELLLSHAAHLLNQARTSQAVDEIEEAVAMLEQCGDTATIARFRVLVLNVYFTAGLLARGLEILGRDGSWAERPLDMENVSSRALRAIMLGYMGQLGEARSDLRNALRVAEANNQRVSWFNSNLVEMDYFIGSSDDAMHQAQAARSAAEEFGSPFFTSMATRALALAHILRQDYEAAAQVLENGRAAVAAGAPGHQFESEHLALMADVALQQGDSHAALSLAEAALASARKAGARLLEINSRLTLARAQIACGAEEALIEEHIRAVQTLIEDTGATIYTGFLHNVQALLYDRQGQGAQALQARQAASQAFSQCGAHARADQIEKEIAAFSGGRAQRAESVQQ